MEGADHSPALMAGTPCAKFPLAEVKRVLRIAAIGKTVSTRAAEDYNLALPSAEQFIRDVISGLESDAFVETKPQHYPGRPSVEADIYAIKHRKGDCYIKLHIMDGRVIVLSCHIPEYPLKRVDGKIIGAPR